MLIPTYSKEINKTREVAKEDVNNFVKRLSRKEKFAATAASYIWSKSKDLNHVLT